MNIRCWNQLYLVVESTYLMPENDEKIWCWVHHIWCWIQILSDSKYRLCSYIYDIQKGHVVKCLRWGIFHLQSSRFATRMDDGGMGAGGCHQLFLGQKPWRGPRRYFLGFWVRNLNTVFVATAIFKSGFSYQKPTFQI